MKAKSIVAIGIGIVCLLCSAYISYTIIQRGFRYYGIGRDYVEQGTCTINTSVLQHRKMGDATPREGPMATMRGYFDVNYSRHNRTKEHVSAIAQLDDAGWTGDVDTVTKDLDKYAPGTTVNCIAGKRTIDFYAKDLNSVEHLIVLGHDAKEVKRKFKVSFYSGIAVGVTGVLVCICASIFAVFHERQRGVAYTQIN